MHYNNHTKLIRNIKEVCQQRNFKYSEVGRVGKNKQYPYIQVQIEPPEFSKTLLVISGVHGDEPAPVTAVVEFLREYEVDYPVKLIIFPCLNPTAMRIGTRKNWEGKDLNRSRHWYFQPEQALCLLHSYGQKIDAVISLHEDWMSRHAYGFGFNRKYKKYFQELLKSAGEYLPVVSKDSLEGMPVEDGVIYDKFDTSLEARFAEAGVPRCFCSETGMRADFNSRVRANVAIIQKATETLK
ncbi:succinylglutamate desuccinylase/aspartoacylase family protein [Patescibacteria group bacterium]|nr:succinylglutamate desuccinylase/aspartoacylase family protein [Patescibacteria group bacterium]